MREADDHTGRVAADLVCRSEFALLQLCARHFVGERRVPTELGLQQFVDTIGELAELAQGLHDASPLERRGGNVGDSVDAVRRVK